MTNKDLQTTTHKTKDTTMAKRIKDKMTNKDLQTTPHKTKDTTMAKR